MQTTKLLFVIGLVSTLAAFARTCGADRHRGNRSKHAKRSGKKWPSWTRLPPPTPHLRQRVAARPTAAPEKPAPHAPASSRTNLPRGNNSKERPRRAGRTRTERPKSCNSSEFGPVPEADLTNTNASGLRPCGGMALLEVSRRTHEVGRHQRFPCPDLVHPLVIGSSSGPADERQGGALAEIAPSVTKRIRSRPRNITRNALPSSPSLRACLKIPWASCSRRKGRMARRDEEDTRSGTSNRGATPPASLSRENPPGGGPFARGRHWLGRHSPLRGCSDLPALATAKIPRPDATQFPDRLFGGICAATAGGGHFCPETACSPRPEPIPSTLPERRVCGRSRG